MPRASIHGLAPCASTNEARAPGGICGKPETRSGLSLTVMLTGLGADECIRNDGSAGDQT